MPRSFALFVVMLLALAGCKQPQSPAAAPPGFVSGGTDIAIDTVRIVPAVDNAAFGTDQFYVVTFTFRNDLGYALIPRIDHFVLEDADQRRFLGADSGSPALVGLSNPATLLKAGDSQKYTIGFRVPENTTGTLYYDATL